MTPTALSLLTQPDLAMIEAALQEFASRPWRKKSEVQRAKRLASLIIDAHDELEAVTGA